MSAEAKLVAVVRHHQAGLLLDTNVLLLLLADAADPEFATRWERTDRFTPTHVRLLRAAADAALSISRLVTTPHILTEATNLITDGPAHDKHRARMKELLRQFALKTRERYLPSRLAAEDWAFSRLGLADVAQALLARRKNTLVLTDDAPLTRELETRGLPVANLTHYAFPIDIYGR